MFIDDTAEVLELMGKKAKAAPANESKLIAKSMGQTIRIAMDHPYFPVRWSVKAKELAKKLDIPLHMRWQTQHRYDKGRSTFLLEHRVTINSMVKRIIDNPDSALDVLKGAEMVWVTRDEDLKLTAMGYRIKRPDDAYERAGIELAPGNY